MRKESQPAAAREQRGLADGARRTAQQARSRGLDPGRQLRCPTSKSTRSCAGWVKRRSPAGLAPAEFTSGVPSGIPRRGILAARCSAVSARRAAAQACARPWQGRPLRASCTEAARSWRLACGGAWPRRNRAWRVASAPGPPRPSVARKPRRLPRRRARTLLAHRRHGAFIRNCGRHTNISPGRCAAPAARLRVDAALGRGARRCCGDARLRGPAREAA